VSKIILLSALTILILGGCDNKEEPKQPPETTAKAEPAPVHAAPGVKPGSYEDWCGEHQVPESLCSRCNPSLIAAFKATGDWCAEHELPESQCLICNPDLKIERPPKPEASP
jgi:uncharacterized lipoprotein NlpE involved in copper resistance